MDIKAKVIDYLNSQQLGIDFDGFLSNEQFTTVEEIRTILEAGNAFNIEIIYYSTAIDYLKENDPSLRLSLELAEDLGYNLKQLTSETLASLLASDLAQLKFSSIENELEEMLQPKQIDLVKIFNLKK
jgi:hypothetical protein